MRRVLAVLLTLFMTTLVACEKSEQSESSNDKSTTKQAKATKKNESKTERVGDDEERRSEEWEVIFEDWEYDRVAGGRITAMDVGNDAWQLNLGSGSAYKGEEKTRASANMNVGENEDGGWEKNSFLITVTDKYKCRSANSMEKKPIDVSVESTDPFRASLEGKLGCWPDGDNKGLEWYDFTMEIDEEGLPKE